MSKISLNQTLKLTQKLSPLHIQMIKLLELPTMQLEQRVKQEIESNPMLDDGVLSDSKEEDDEEDGFVKDTSIDQYITEDDTPAYKYQVNNYSKDDKQMPLVVTEANSLRDYLLEQLRFKDISGDSFVIAEYLIGSLDDDGYLRRDLDSISNDLEFTLGLDVPMQDIESSLKLIQELEPPGIGARDLRECLLLQLNRVVNTTSSQSLALLILKRYFDDFIKKHYEKLVARLSVDEDSFRSAIDVIISLSPKPANLYSEGSAHEVPYVMPDFVLDYQDGEFDLRMTSSNIPEVKINRRYVDILKESSQKKKLGVQERETVQFVKNKIDSAKWFISAIQQRHDTLMSTMTAILNYQLDYFKHGDTSQLHPMILKDIADVVGLDVSTISRVVNSKYIQTNFGIIPLKRLFSEAMQTYGGEEVSSYEIKKILSECVVSEDKLKPLTDEMLMDILNDKGYRIARRTVAKYREVLGISVARLRKRL